MSTTTLQDITDLPEPVREFAERRKADPTLPPTIENILPGADWESARMALRESGVAEIRQNNGESSFLVADFDKDGNVMHMAAAIPRNPGNSYNFLKEVEDFKSLVTTDRSTRKDAVALFHRIARSEGIGANAINKMAALIATDGKFKVNAVRGQRGRSASTVQKQFEEDLNWWKDKVNSSAVDGVITGDRGVKSFISQGARLAFIEGDHIARHLWSKKKVLLPSGRSLSLPMNLQSYSTQHIEIPEGLEGTNLELMYWTPPRAFIRLLEDTSNPVLKKQLDRLVPPDVRKQLAENNGKYLLDPALLIHIRHRGLPVENYGQSLLEPAMPDFRYKRALDALEIVTITNLINRVVILSVGSDNPESVYHSAEVSSSRLSMLQRIMRAAGPSATILWGGPDLSVKQVSAHDSILSLADRYKVVERRILMALGVPSVILVGEGGDGKAAANAAALALVASVKELRDQYGSTMEDLAVRIAEQNNIKDVSVTWEFSGSILDNKEAAAELVIKMFSLGLLGSETTLEELGFEYSAEEARQLAEVDKKYKERVFGPPPGSQTSNIVGTGGSSGGRPTKEENPARDPRDGKEADAPGT